MFSFLKKIIFGKRKIPEEDIYKKLVGLKCKIILPTVEKIGIVTNVTHKFLVLNDYFIFPHCHIICIEIINTTKIKHDNDEDDFDDGYNNPFVHMP
jgi:hypothetical protein